MSDTTSAEGAIQTIRDRLGRSSRSGTSWTHDSREKAEALAAVGVVEDTLRERTRERGMALRASEQWRENYLKANDRTEAAEARVRELEAALRAIAEGNLGRQAWEADYPRIREFARAALVRVAERADGQADAGGAHAPEVADSVSVVNDSEGRNVHG